MSRLRFSGSGAMQSAGRNNGIPGCHQYGMSRVTSGDKGPSMMADFTASLHGGARCSSASSFWAKCVASSARWRRRAVAVSTNSLLEDRARAQHMMRGCAPTRMSEAAASSMTAAHMINTDNKQVGQTMQTVQANRRSLSHDKRQTRMKKKPLDLTHLNV